MKTKTTKENKRLHFALFMSILKLFKIKLFSILDEGTNVFSPVEKLSLNKTDCQVWMFPFVWIRIRNQKLAFRKDNTLHQIEVCLIFNLRSTIFLMSNFIFKFGYLQLSQNFTNKIESSSCNIESKLLPIFWFTFSQFLYFLKCTKFKLSDQSHFIARRKGRA